MENATIARSGRYRRPHLHEDIIKLKDVNTKVRQIAIRNIGDDELTLLITIDLTTPAKNYSPLRRTHEHRKRTRRLHQRLRPRRALQRRPAQRRLDTTLTVIAGNLYRLFARDLTRYQTATPDTIWRHFLDDPGTLHVTDHSVTCALNLRSHHPQLIDAGYADLKTPIPWWDNRTLQFTFPPR